MFGICSLKKRECDFFRREIIYLKHKCDIQESRILQDISVKSWPRYKDQQTSIQ